MKSQNTGKVTKYSKLEGQQRQLFVPPRIQGMMAGAQYAFQLADGSIGLLYESGREQTRDIGNQIVAIEDFPNFFSIVTFVEEGILPVGFRS